MKTFNLLSLLITLLSTTQCLYSYSSQVYMSQDNDMIIEELSITIKNDEVTPFIDRYLTNNYDNHLRNSKDASSIDYYSIPNKEESDEQNNHYNEKKYDSESDSKKGINYLSGDDYKDTSINSMYNHSRTLSPKTQNHKKTYKPLKKKKKRFFLKKKSSDYSITSPEEASTKSQKKGFTFLGRKKNGNTKKSKSNHHIIPLEQNVSINQNQKIKKKLIAHPSNQSELLYDSSNSYFIGDYSKKMKFTYQNKSFSNVCEKGLQGIDTLLPQLAASSANYITSNTHSSEKTTLLHVILSFTTQKSVGFAAKKYKVEQDGMPLPTSPKKEEFLTKRKLKRYIISSSGSIINSDILNDCVHKFNFHFVQTNPGHCIVGLLQFIQKLNEKKDNMLVKVEVLCTHYPICKHCAWIAKNLLGYNKLTYNLKDSSLALKIAEKGCQQTAFTLPMKGLAYKFMENNIKRTIMKANNPMKMILEIGRLFDSQNQKAIIMQLLNAIQTLSIDLDIARSYMSSLTDGLRKDCKKEEFSSRSDSFYDQDN